MKRSDKNWRGICASNLLAAMLLLNGVLLAQENQGGKKYPAAKNLILTPAASLIKVDGILDEEAWQQAGMLEILYEWTPGENTPAPVKTECLITYDRSKLYIAFRCYDPNPRQIRAHLMDRDLIDTFIQDDHVSIMIDTFNDERRAFQFRVNPLGVQADANFSELEGYEDFSWDAIWASAAKITDFGYSVEIAIPFNQLRFAKGGQTQTWGFEADRSYPREVRHRMSTHVRDRNRECILCQFNKLTGFAGISAGHNLQLTPTLTVQRNDTCSDFPAGEMANGKIDPQFGFTGRWGITPNLMLNAAFNPDFSQVEADVAQLAVNIRFALRYPEKRPFFLEGGDFFLTPLEAVFTRTVFDPLWGLKLTGKSGRNAFGFFGLQDRTNNLLFPSNQGSGNASFDEKVYDGVFRFRRDIGRGSTLGFLYTGRTADGYHNGLSGLDGFLRLSQTKTFTFQFLLSQTKYRDQVAQDFGQKSGGFWGYALYGQFRHVGRNLVAWAEYEDRSPNFRADFGFIPRVDTRRMLLALHPVIWGKPGGWFDRIGIQLRGERITDSANKLTDQSLSLAGSYQGKLQSSVQAFVLVDKEMYNGVTYDKHWGFFYGEMKPWGGLYLTCSSQLGDSVDYTNSRLAQTFQVNPGIEFALGRHVNVNLNHFFERLATEGERIYLANLLQTRLIYNINVRSFVRAIVQYTAIDRITALYNEPTDNKTRMIFTQFLFSYKINPQTVLFLGYSDTGLGNQSIDVTKLNRTLFLKIGYAWLL